MSALAQAVCESVHPLQRAHTSAYKRPNHDRFRVVPSRLENDAKGTDVHPERAGKFSQGEFRARLGAALRRRLHPNTTILPKVVAAAIGVTDETILNWANGYSDPSSHRMGLLMEFFSDPAFWPEVYGPIGVAMRQRYAQRCEACGAYRILTESNG